MTRLLAAALAAAALLGPGSEAPAYVEAAYSLGKLVQDSTNILLMQVEKLDKEKNLIIYRKVRDIKGVHPADQIYHNIGRGGFHPREWSTVMAWAEVGRLAVFFHNGSASETCIDNYWYQAYPGQWWSMSHAEPYLLRTFAGRPERLAAAVAAMLAGQETTVPCMADGDKNALQLRSARVLRMRVSLKIQDHDPKRDFSGWGAEEFQPLSNMPGFTHYSAVGKLGFGAMGVAAADFNADRRPDLCLFGLGRVILLQNDNGSLGEAPLGLEGGARWAGWADFNGDGRSDLLLAAPTGPRLLANERGTFRDVSAGLPRQGYSHVTAAAWIDFDGDGRPDILLADGFRGLRLWLNKASQPASPQQPKLGRWYCAGPFDNTDRRGFEAVYPPERQVDISAEYAGKNGLKVIWKEADLPDGQTNSLLGIFPPEVSNWSAVYLYRELDFGAAAELPVSMGSDDTLTVWLNGQKLIAQNEYRGCAPDQAVLKLPLQQGRNRLLVKICQGDGEFAFYFSARDRPTPVPQLFEDVSDQVGLGESGPGGRLKGDRLTVADVNNDGREDFLYSAGQGLLMLNTPGGFVEARSSGISYRPGGVSPAFGDFDGDGRADLFVPQDGRCGLYRNEGGGRFRDVAAGDLARPIRQATCAVWADLSGRGRPDLLVGCLRGPNRFFRNAGSGAFTDAGDEIGLYRRIFNTRGMSLVDVNNDGVPDVVLSNEGQDSAVLLGSPAVLGRGPAGARR